MAPRLVAAAISQPLSAAADLAPHDLYGIHLFSLNHQFDFYVCVNFKIGVIIPIPTHLIPTHLIQQSPNKPQVSVQGRFLRLGTASMLAGGGDPTRFINADALDMKKFVRRPALAKVQQLYRDAKRSKRMITRLICVKAKF